MRPYRSSLDLTVHRSDLRHCHHLEKILYLQKIARERAGLSLQLDPIVISDNDFVNSVGNDLDEILEGVHEHIGVQILPAEIHSNSQVIELRSDLVSHMYVGIMEPLFLNIFMKKYKVLNTSNI